MKLDQKQKAIIRNVFFAILTLVSILGMVCYIIQKIPELQNNDFVKHYAPFISILAFGFPIIIGFFTKYLLGRHQQNQIEQTLKNYGVEIVKKEKQTKNPYKIKEQPYFEWNEFKSWVHDDKILLVFDIDSKYNKKEKYNRINQFLCELNNKIRQDMDK